MFISEKDYLMGRDKKYPISQEQKNNMMMLLAAVNGLLGLCPLQMKFEVSSGYRPEEINSKVVGASKTSAHISCQAIDIKDPDQQLAKWIKGKPELLIALGLYLEHPDSTPTWVHFQIRAPASGRRIFRPFPVKSWHQTKTDGTP
jgi:hypothetical protein